MAKRARGEADWEEVAAIGARLRAARLAAGMSQTALADRLAVRQPDVSDWERGVHLPESRVIARWAEITDADLRELLNLSGTDNASGMSSPEHPELLVADAA